MERRERVITVSVRLPEGVLDAQQMVNLQNGMEDAARRGVWELARPHFETAPVTVTSTVEERD